METVLPEISWAGAAEREGESGDRSESGHWTGAQPGERLSRIERAEEASKPKPPAISRMPTLGDLAVWDVRTLRKWRNDVHPESL